MSSTKTNYDAVYKRLFSNPAMLEELMRFFVSETLADDLDFDEITGMETTTFSIDLEKREGDHLWKIERRSGRDFYLMFLLEFQSKNDFTMAVRIFSYAARLYDGLAKSQGNVEALSLPPMMAVVLYSGSSKWTAKRSFRELLELDATSEIWEDQPMLTYRLIEASSAEAHEESLVSLVFQLEHTRSEKAFAKHLMELKRLLRTWQNDEVFQDIVIWLEAVLSHKSHGLHPTAEQIEIFLESEEMSTHQLGIDVLFEKREEKGRAEGKAEGKIEGKFEGLQQMLEAMLTQKFGENEQRSALLAVISEDAWLEAPRVIFTAESEDAFWSALGVDQDS